MRSSSRISTIGKLAISFTAALLILAGSSVILKAMPRARQSSLASAPLLAANVQKEVQKTPSGACGVDEPVFDGNSDVQGIADYGDFIRDLLHGKKFKELDCIANRDRSTKAKFSGGMWKLHEFYWAASHTKGHATEEDLKDKIELAQAWVDTIPESITARVVLAESYIDYAWDARGSDTSDSVTDSGWKLFSERLEKAKSILDDAAALPAKCPETYFAMQYVALGQQWDREKVDDLFKRAVAFEPGYFYYYRSHAYYLMPQWNGEQGDATRFAQESADLAGGDAGDILYFQIAAKIVCACNDPEFLSMSWPRLKKGYTLLEAKYGPSQTLLNAFALMAVKHTDWLTASDAFKRIGDGYVKSTWITEEYFKQNRDIAGQIAPQLARVQAKLDEAAANAKSPDGAEYKKRVEQALLPIMRQCVLSSGNDQQKMQFAIQVGKDGSCDNLAAINMSAAGQCISKSLYEGHVKNEKPFPVPPHEGYWVDMLLDPAAVSAKATN